MSIVLAAGKKVGKRVCLISVGRLGNSGEQVWKNLQGIYAPAIDFITLGPQSPGDISALMQRADFGVAASPWYLIGKSGSVMAMLDHGLPVIVTRIDFQPPISSEHPDDPLLHRCDATLESKLVAGLPKRAPRSRVGDVTRKFLACLADSATSP